MSNTTTITNITSDNYQDNFYTTSSISVSLSVRVRRPAGNPNPINAEVAYDDPTSPDTIWFRITIDAIDFPVPSLLPQSPITGVTGFRIVPANDTPAYTMDIDEILPTVSTT